MNDQELQDYSQTMEDLRRRVVVKEKIIETAGKTWQYLKDHGETGLSLLPRRLRERSDIVNQAVGWLAREDKLCYSQRNGKTVVSLTN